MSRSVTGTLIAALAFIASTAGRVNAAPPTPAPPVFSSGVELITVDAVVVDDKGQPVKGLTRDDFVVKEDGEAKDIVSFEPFVFDAPPDVKPTPQTAVASNETSVKDPGRAFGIVIDDAGITPAESAQAIRTVSTFIEKSLRAGDAVLLATTTGDAWWNARLPADRADLLAVVARLKGKYIEAPVSNDYLSEYEAFQIVAYEAHTMGRMTQRVVDRWLESGICPNINGRPVSTDSCQALVQGRAADIDSYRKRRTRLATDAVGRVADALSPIRGRKSLLLFSRGFPEDPGATQMRDLVAATREANTAVYFLDVRGLQAQRMGTGDVSQVGGANPMDVGAIGFESGTLATAGSQSLAEETGGFSIRNTSMDAGAVRVADESRIFYLLGFYPSSGKKADQWRKLRVEVKQKGLTVRARRGFTLRNSMLTTEKADVHAKKASETVVRALDSPRDLTDVPVRAMSYVMEERPNEGKRDKDEHAGWMRVRVGAEIDARRLKYEDSVKSRVARLEVSVIATHRDTPLMQRSDQRVEIRVPEGEAPGWRALSRELELPPGVSQIRVAVRDLESGALGTVLQRLVVPPPVGLRLSTPIVTDKVDKSGPRPTALIAVHRTFAPEGQLFCQYEVFGAKPDPKTGIANVVAGFELIPSDGKPAIVSPVTAIVPDSTGRIVRLLGFPVADRPEGTYDLAILVKDEVTGDMVERHEAFTLAHETP